MSPPAPARRPLITANMVTFARLVSMPLVAMFLYKGASGQWTALVLGTLVGCTDFVDGYLARKQGPTVLGGLMDPIADKVFIAMIYIPYMDLGRFPAWAIALLFVRELLVTGLRTAYELRGLAMKTSYLAKVKTWVQMMGIGLVWLFMAITDRALLMGIILGGVALSLAAVAVFWAVKRRLWKGALVMAAGVGILALLYLPDDLDFTISATVIGIVAITWLSGLDYVVGGLRQLRGHGDFGAADLARLLGAIALPCLIVAVMVATEAKAWPLASLLSVELAVGGLDNLLAHHRVAASPLAWNVRQLGAAALLAAALGLDALGRPGLVDYAVLAALAVSALGTAREFWRGRDYYLDARLRDKQRRAEVAAVPDPDTSVAVSDRRPPGSDHLRAARGLDVTRRMVQRGALLVAVCLTGCFYDPGPEPEPEPEPNFCRQPGPEPAADAPRWQYLIDTIDLAETGTEASARAIDLDCASGSDNNLGFVLNILEQQGYDLDGDANALIAEGAMLHLIELRAGDRSDADAAAVTLRHGVDADGDPSDNFSGQERFERDDARGFGRLTGAIEAGHLIAEPGGLPLAIAFPGRDEPYYMTLVGARIEADLVPEGLTGTIAGGLPMADVDGSLLPALHDGLSRIIARDCPDGVCAEGSFGGILRELFDNDGDGEMTLQELREDELIVTLFAADVNLLNGAGEYDPGADGESDSLSIAVGFTAIPAAF